MNGKITADIGVDLKIQTKTLCAQAGLSLTDFTKLAISEQVRRLGGKVKSKKGKVN